MIKKISIFFLIIFSLSFLIYNETTQLTFSFAGDNETVKTTQDQCKFLLGDINDENSLAHFLQEAFNLIKYGGPILCIVMSMIEYFKAIISQDKDALLKATKRTGKRIAYALILFFVPTLINFIFPLLGWMGTCSIG